MEQTDFPLPLGMQLATRKRRKAEEENLSLSMGSFHITLRATWLGTNCRSCEYSEMLSIHQVFWGEPQPPARPFGAGQPRGCCRDSLECRDPQLDLPGGRRAQGWTDTACAATLPSRTKERCVTAPKRFLEDSRNLSRPPP